MQKLTEVLAMGGYAAYIWPSFLVATFIMVGLTAVSLRSQKRAKQTLDRLQNTQADEA